ncbi:uncharacterized protein LOC110102953 [Dendrobium catenatum]|uniref:Uncharacterized protein n=1 Tax=Dendrobium catenatum TaxID=906689 RepID=A0A2I0WS05_9ASPA|nr:uncharacterized protein LOC110102953 [Dendrobium catenatum]PKU78455.1 hypothetical protein MA16_Dca018846 [Dendrobium catenatum]
MEEPTVASRQGQEARERKPNPSNQEGAEPIAAAANASDNKRKPDNGGFHNSEYVKVRAIVKELRPFFMEVLHTPDFRESKAAYEIKKRMKTMIELTKQLIESASTLKPSKVHEQPLHGAAIKEENAEKKVEVNKQITQTQQSEILAASGNSRIVTKQKVESKVGKLGTEGASRGTFVVGGSPLGWNFLLYPGPKLVYYGRTKASVLASRASK